MGYHTPPVRHHVFLIPGFFGFAHLGGLYYFKHVHERLDLAFREAGLTLSVHQVKTLPTASIERRAARAFEALAAEVGDDGSPIHLVGHSSGGLDARLLVTPGVKLPGYDDRIERWVSRVRSVVTVATPHFGTPTASFFRSVFGQQVLRAISVATMYAVRSGRAPIRALAHIARLLTVSRAAPGSAGYNLANQLYDDLLRDFSPDRRAAVKEFLEEVNTDRSLLTQLTPETIGLFNAAAQPRPTVRYGSVVTASSPPALTTQLRIGLDPYAQVTYAVYRALHRLAASMPARHLPNLTQAQRDFLAAELGYAPDDRSNDGIVPSLSQVFGEIVHAVTADHLDVVGHFEAPHLDPPHYDWLRTGSGFRQHAFASLWRDAARFMIAA
jgi:triacylglycerol lipase